MRGLKLAFSKMHGAGNDFVVLDLRDGRPAPDPALCARIADRHLIAAYDDEDALNTAPATAGFAIDSPSATHAVARDADAGFVIDMGTPRFAPQAVPLLGWDAAEDAYALAVDGGTVRFGAVSMGNPHAVIEVAEVAHAPVAAIGAALQRAPAFPQSVNAGFAEVVARDRIRLRVFERGVGETLACGSGACAAVAVLVRGGRIDADREVAVELPGGTLRIRYDRAAERIHMGGPTAFVFEGEW